MRKNIEFKPLPIKTNDLTTVHIANLLFINQANIENFVYSTLLSSSYNNIYWDIMAGAEHTTRDAENGYAHLRAHPLKQTTYIDSNGEESDWKDFSPNGEVMYFYATSNTFLKSIDPVTKKKTVCIRIRKEVYDAIRMSSKEVYVLGMDITGSQSMGMCAIHRSTLSMRAEKKAMIAENGRAFVCINCDSIPNDTKSIGWNPSFPAVRNYDPQNTKMAPGMLGIRFTELSSVSYGKYKCNKGAILAKNLNNGKEKLCVSLKHVYDILVEQFGEGALPKYKSFLTAFKRHDEHYIMKKFGIELTRMEKSKKREIPIMDEPVQIPIHEEYLMLEEMEQRKLEEERERIFGSKKKDNGENFLSDENSNEALLFGDEKSSSAMKSSPMEAPSLEKGGEGNLPHGNFLSFSHENSSSDGCISEDTFKGSSLESSPETPLGSSSESPSESPSESYSEGSLGRVSKIFSSCDNEACENFCESPNRFDIVKVNITEPPEGDAITRRRNIWNE